MKAENASKIESHAKYLKNAWIKGKSVDSIMKIDSSFSVDEAYQVQLYNIDKEVKNGYRVTGKKIGLTSKAMQDLLGVDEPDYGHLLNKMEIKNGDTISLKRLFQPKVEGELAFILKDDLVGPNVTTLEVLQATDAVLPSLEIVDSRIKDWNITLADTVADNASSGLYVLGRGMEKITSIDVKQIGMALYKNGELQNTGVGVAALGNPAKSIAWLANKLATYDIKLKSGEVILSGALSAAVEAKPGDHFYAKFSELGEVHVTFTK